VTVRLICFHRPAHIRGLVRMAQGPRSSWQNASNHQELSVIRRTRFDEDGLKPTFDFPKHFLFERVSKWTAFESVNNTSLSLMPVSFAHIGQEITLIRRRIPRRHHFRLRRSSATFSPFAHNTTVARSMNNPCSTTPGMSLNLRARPGGSGIRPKLQSRI
jgi:hypothetical protein